MKKILNILALALFRSSKVVFNTTMEEKSDILTSAHIAIATKETEYASEKDLCTRLETFGLIINTAAKFATENNLTFDIDFYSINCINITFETDKEIFSLWIDWESYAKMHEVWLKGDENNG